MKRDSSIEQAIRVSHCSHPDNDNGHACVGECKITINGLELSCKLCGTDQRPIISPIERMNAVKATAVLKAAGLDFDKLAPMTQRAVLNVLARDYCKGCSREHFHVGVSDYLFCDCGWSYSNHRGWKPSPTLSDSVSPRPAGADSTESRSPGVGTRQA